MNHPRPSLFIGSSAEGLGIAKAIQCNLDRLCEVQIWSQGVFGLSSGTLETLVAELPRFDFAILVLTPDDLTVSRDRQSPSPRDNVLLELGLSIGMLGRERTFIVHDRTADIKLPSDLAGVTLASYQPHSSGEIKAALGAASTNIETAINKLGKRCKDNSPLNPNEIQTPNKQKNHRLGQISGNVAHVNSMKECNQTEPVRLLTHVQELEENRKAEFENSMLDIPGNSADSQGCGLFRLYYIDECNMKAIQAKKACENMGLTVILQFGRASQYKMSEALVVYYSREDYLEKAFEVSDAVGNITGEKPKVLKSPWLGQTPGHLILWLV